MYISTEKYLLKETETEIKKRINKCLVKLSPIHLLDSKWHPLELTYLVTILKTLDGTCQNSGHKGK